MIFKEKVCIFVTRSLFEDLLKTDLGIVIDDVCMKSSAEFYDSFLKKVGRSQKRS